MAAKKKTTRRKSPGYVVEVPIRLKNAKVVRAGSTATRRTHKRKAVKRKASKRKTTKRRATTRRKTVKRKASTHHVHHRRRRNVLHKEDNPDYVVQVTEPRMVRKDILEALREVIIFMQGYDEFRRIQQEKVKHFSQLRLDIKHLNMLISDKLHALLPKGKLAAISVPEPTEPIETIPDFGRAPPKAPPVEVVKPFKIDEEQEINPESELDHLEEQLREIEGELEAIK